MAHHEMRDHRQAPVYPRGGHPERVRRHQRREVEFAAGDENLYSNDVSAACMHLLNEVVAFLFTLTDDELAAIDPNDRRLNRVLRVRLASRSKDQFEVFDEMLIGGYGAIANEQDRRKRLTGHQRIAENARRREWRGDLS